MSCTSPCITCSVNNFYSCSTCDTTLGYNSTPNGSLCLNDPTWFIQLACTCMLAIFVFFPMLRKRSLVLTKIFDIIQTAAYFKYIAGFIYYRHNYLYLDMRGMLPWSEGWKLLSVTNDMTIPIFLTEQTQVNKLIRIGSIWLGVVVIILIIGMLKSMCGDSKLTFSTFISKNISNCMAIAFNLTIQDISFYCANVFYGFSLSGMLNIIFFAIAIFLSITILILIIWQFSIINHNYEDIKEDSLYHIQHMFLYRMDYDLFQTYSLTNLPQHQKKCHRYSNLALIELIRKIGYGFLVASFLYKTADYYSQVYQLLGFIVFFQLLWYIALPFDHKKQIAQLIINIIADILLLTLLVFPLLFNSSNMDFIYMIMCLSLFGLAALSALLQIFIDLYTFIPYDLYDIGLTIIIEDKQLLKELERRKKEQEENQKKIKQQQQENERLLQELKLKKTTKSSTTKRKKTVTIRENESQASIDKQQKPNRQDSLDQHLDNATNDPNQFAYPIENQSNNSDQDDLSKYKIDLKKKRKVYEFDKKKPFVYSNKVQI